MAAGGRVARERAACGRKIGLPLCSLSVVPGERHYRCAEGRKCLYGPATSRRMTTTNAAQTPPAHRARSRLHFARSAPYWVAGRLQVDIYQTVLWDTVPAVTEPGITKREEAGARRSTSSVPGGPDPLGDPSAAQSRA
jgi:hypothetical protein